MRPRIFLSLFAVFFFVALPVIAAASDNGETFPTSRVWQVRFDQPDIAPRPLKVEVDVAAQEPAAQPRPQAFEYSNAYTMRRKIHMIASYATIPLFVGQYISGDKLFDQAGGEADSTAKSAHGPLAAGIAALFAVNTVTGVWNLVEARHDPNGHTRRLVHGLMMLGANLGFVVTGMMAPDDDEIGGSDRSMHRNAAIASMGVATASYVYMLVTR